MSDGHRFHEVRCACGGVLWWRGWWVDSVRHVLVWCAGCGASCWRVTQRHELHTAPGRRRLSVALEHTLAQARVLLRLGRGGAR